MNSRCVIWVAWYTKTDCCLKDLEYHSRSSSWLVWTVKTSFLLWTIRRKFGCFLCDSRVSKETKEEQRQRLLLLYVVVALLIIMMVVLLLTRNSRTSTLSLAFVADLTWKRGPKVVQAKPFQKASFLKSFLFVYYNKYRG